MKKLLLSLSVVLLSITGFSQDEVVNIPDVNFLNALIDEGVDTNEDGKIQKSEALVVHQLDVIGKSISDLKGIRNFKNLEFLNCRYNQLSSLVLSDLPEGTEFTPKDKMGLHKLKYLDCSNNSISNLEVYALENLLELNCSSNKLTYLSLSGLQNLLELNCRSNELTSLDESELISLTLSL